MPGRLIDLGQPDPPRLPDSLVIDTSLLVARFNLVRRPPTLPSSAHAVQFFRMLRHQPVEGVLTSVVIQEFLHLAIRELFRDEIANHHVALTESLPTRRRFDWLDLFKTMPELLDDFSPQLQRLQRLLVANNLRVLQPYDLAQLPDGTRWETELLRLVGRYHLDTADAAILLDAQRAGITAIATLDADLRRAQLDFDVYTWLS